MDNLIDKVKTLTQSERRTYQSLVSRGVSPEDAVEDALDGVQVEDVRVHYAKKKR